MGWEVREGFWRIKEGVEALHGIGKGCIDI